MEIYEKICKIAEKKTLTAKDKEFVAKFAAEQGVELNPLCPNCYHDAAVQLAVILKPKEVATDSGCDYELREGLDVVLSSYRYGEMRICKALLTNDNAKRWIAAGCPLRFFTKLPANED